MTDMGRKVWSDPAKANPMLNRIPLRRFAGKVQLVQYSPAGNVTADERALYIILSTRELYLVIRASAVKGSFSPLK